MNKCPYCRTRLLARARNGNVKASCGAPECLKGRERERKRMVRAKARGEAPAASVGPAPSLETEGAFLAPWGQVYTDKTEAWADCLLTGGLDGSGSVSWDEQNKRMEMLRVTEPSS